MWAWIWFAAFLCAVGYIVILKRAGAIDNVKAEAAIEQSAHDLGDAFDAGIEKGKEQMDKLRSKDDPPK